MIKTSITKVFDGELFMSQLAQQGLSITNEDFYMDGEGNLVVLCNVDTEVLTSVLDEHDAEKYQNDKKSVKESARSKLAALGLTPEEIATLSK